MDCKIKQSALEYADRFSEGIFPESFEELTEFGQALVKINAKVAQTIAVIVAIGETHFGTNRSEWINWCREEFDITDASYRCHLRQVGKMLLYLRNHDCKIKQFKRIFPIAFDKLLAIARIPENRLASFFSHYPGLDAMERDKVRAAVAAFLNEKTVSVATQQPLLPGFDEALDTLLAIDEDRLISMAGSGKLDIVTATSMSRSGIKLCKASIGYVADHFDELVDAAPESADMLDAFAADIEMLHERLNAAVTARRRRLLGN